MFQQLLNPLHNVLGSTLLALVPVVVLLLSLAVFRLSAWKSVIVGAVATLLLAVLVWHTPVAAALGAYGVGAGTGFWSIDWIVFWGVILYNTLVVTGAFGGFQRWLVSQATADVRVQALLIAWAFGALLEGLVGFGYPWAVVAPLLIGFGIVDLAALRVAALANNAPVSFGALGAPIIGLAAVTGLPLDALSASVGKIVALLALAPPWILIYLVSGKRGFRDGWPLALVASFGYILGQFPSSRVPEFPSSQFLGPYLPDVLGSLVCFGVLLLFLRFWRPATILGFGGRELSQEEIAAAHSEIDAGEGRARSAWRGLFPFVILIVVVVAWTGPWSSLSKYEPFKPAVKAVSSLTHQVSKTSFEFSPFVAGTAILVSWLLVLAFLRPNGAQLKQVFRDTFRQMWGALVVGVLIFGLADLYNFSGMANSMAFGFAKLGPVFVVLSPILGWIAVALSGSNASSNAVFGHFQFSVAQLLHAPLLLFPGLNSLGAEVGKPVAPQTASVGVATTRFVRDEGQVIRYNLPWTLIILAYLVVLGVLFYLLMPGAVSV
jgi:lactate permease